MVLNRQEKTPLPGSPDKAQAAYIHTWRRCIVTTRLRTASPLPRSEHSFGKVGDHWEPKDEPGPSDAQDAKRGAEARASTTPTAGGPCERDEGESARHREASRHRGKNANDQGRARRGYRPGEPSGHVESDKQVMDGSSDLPRSRFDVRSPAEHS